MEQPDRSAPLIKDQPPPPSGLSPAEADAGPAIGHGDIHTVEVATQVRPRHGWAAAALGTILAFATVYPWLGRGWVLVLDWVRGPRTVTSPSLFGFSLPPSPAAWALNEAQAVLGGSTLSWFLIAICFPLACVSFSRLAPSRRAATCAGATFYAVNPIVYERIAAGQVLFVLGYALLPAAVASFHRALREARPKAAGPAMWIVGLSLISIHFVWIAGLAALAVSLAHRRRETVAWALKLALAIALMEAYALIPLASGRSSGVTVGLSDLQSYRTASDPTLGLYGNVLSLYGFWREGVPLPKDVDVLWPVILAVIIVLTAHGARMIRGSSDSAILQGLGVGAILGYFLALGDQGPTGALYRLLYRHLPGFQVMREAQKFDTLVALFLAVGFAFGVDAVAGRFEGRRFAALAIASAGVVMPLAYTPTLFGGLDGHVRASAYPAQWDTANAIMGSGPGTILFLPWHEYLEFPFTHGTVIANPAQTFFQRSVISGDNVEVGVTETESTSPRSAYLEGLFSMGSQISDFGHLVAQLGISYVALAHAVDYESYGWLYRQSDLSISYESSAITVFRNRVSVHSQGSRVTSWTTAPSIQQLMSLSRSPGFDSTAVGVGTRPGRAPGVGMAVPDITRMSPTSYRIGPGPTGWAVLPEPFDAAWKVNGRSGLRLANGLVAFPVGTRPVMATFTTWHYVMWGYAVSALSLAAGMSIVACRAFRRRQTRP